MTSLIIIIGTWLKNAGNKLLACLSRSPAEPSIRQNLQPEIASEFVASDLPQESKCTGYQPDHAGEVLIGIDPPCAVCGVPKREHVTDPQGSEMTPERLEMFRRVIADNHQRADIIKHVDLCVRYLAEFPTELWGELVHVDNAYMARLHQAVGTAFTNLTDEQRADALKATTLTIERHDRIRQLPEIFFTELKPALTKALRVRGFDRCQNE
jgi:hypothetical protein